MIYGQRYQSASPVFIWLIFSQSVAFITFFFVELNNSRNRQKLNTVYSVVILGIAFIVHWFLISKYGIIGVGWAKLILSFVGLVLLTILTNQFLSRMQSRILFRVISLLFLFLFVIICMYLVTDNFWVKFSVLGFFYMAFLYRLFTSDEKVILKEVIRDRILLVNTKEGQQK